MRRAPSHTPECPFQPRCLAGHDSSAAANLFAASQPGQSLYSLATSAPPNAQAVFGSAPSFGTPEDPVVGKPIGGVIVFGGGLPLYDSKGKIVGGLGLSGDTSCADDIMAWKVRHQLQLDAVSMGPSPDHNDNMILDWSYKNSPSGFGHPTCKGGNPPDDIIKELSKKYPTAQRRVDPACANEGENYLSRRFKQLQENRSEPYQFSLKIYANRNRPWGCAGVTKLRGLRKIGKLKITPPLDWQRQLPPATAPR